MGQKKSRRRRHRLGLLERTKSLMYSGAKTSEAYGVGRLPLPVGNLTSEASLPDGEDGLASKAVGEYSGEQAVHVSRLEAIKYCVNPELHLTEAASEYLPCDLYEEAEAYQIRLGRSYSTFRPFYSHLRNLIVGTALRRPIHFDESASQRWLDLFDNINLEGHSLQSFTKTLFTEALDGGCAGLFVEYPKAEENASRADEIRAGYRPYFVVIPNRDILGWNSEVTSVTLGDKTIYGRKLTSLRIKDVEIVQSDQDEFESVQLPVVRVYDFDGLSDKVRYRKFVMRTEADQKDGKYRQEESSYLSVETIPFAPVYGGPIESYMVARPLLLDVARLNLYHWSSSADLANQLHLSAVPKLVISGASGQVDFENSPDKCIILDSPDARAEWLGAPMDGAEVSMKNLQSIEEGMEKLAAVAMSPSQTAQAESGFSKLLDRAQSDSLLAVLVQGLEEALNIGIQLASEYWSEVPVKASISKDFIPTKLHSQQILAYTELWKEGTFSHEMFLHMLEVGDIFDGIPNFDIEEEISKVKSEQKEKMMMEQEVQSSSINGRQAPNAIEGARVKQLSEASTEAGEGDKPSTPSA